MKTVENQIPYNRQNQKHNPFSIQDQAFDLQYPAEEIVINEKADNGYRKPCIGCTQKTVSGDQNEVEDHIQKQYRGHYISDDLLPPGRNEDIHEVEIQEMECN